MLRFLYMARVYDATDFRKHACVTRTLHSEVSFTTPFSFLLIFFTFIKGDSKSLKRQNYGSNHKIDKKWELHACVCATRTQNYLTHALPSEQL